jgi:hypothetical protein
MKKRVENSNKLILKNKLLKNKLLNEKRIKDRKRVKFYIIILLLGVLCLFIAVGIFSFFSNGGFSETKNKFIEVLLGGLSQTKGGGCDLDGICDFGECDSGCVLDCSPEECCGDGKIQNIFEEECEKDNNCPLTGIFHKCQKCKCILG